MVIGVLADTHIPGRAKALPEIVLRHMAGADHIIHAGDIRCAAVLEQLSRLAPVTAVAGNIDPPELAEALGDKRIVTLDGFRLGVTHGHGQGGTTQHRALARFKADHVDCVIFGHSHIPVCMEQDGILLLNPGSPTDKRRNPYYSFGVIETGGKLTAHILFFDAQGRIIEQIFSKQ